MPLFSIVATFVETSPSAVKRSQYTRMVGAHLRAFIDILRTAILVIFRQPTLVPLVDE